MIDEMIKQAEIDKVDPRLIEVVQRYRKEFYIQSVLSKLKENLE
jgi:hypothetical protein